MGVIALTDGLTTGNPFIDDDHRQLIGLIDALIAATDSGEDNELTRYRIDSLMVYARRHFDREEVEMKHIKYPATQAHAADHTKLLKDLLKLKRALDVIGKAAL